MQIILNLTDETAAAFAEFYNYNPTVNQVDEAGGVTEVANPQTTQEFITEILVGKIKDSIVENRNRKAIDEVKSLPEPIITTDQPTEGSV